uniref:Uncharacterized protein n=1 Tax=Nelumbo nucifera TaxID=4432 RepID=A0A822YNU5_NELNU|nr:TPA_asm: hypothetical protein HUJ06_009799 [Nelumbo nucifera]
MALNWLLLVRTPKSFHLYTTCFCCVFPLFFQNLLHSGIDARKIYAPTNNTACLCFSTFFLSTSSESSRMQEKIYA